MSPTSSLCRACLGLLLVSTACCSLSSSRDAYLEVRKSLLSNPVAIYKISPLVGINESVDVYTSFLPYQILFVNEAEMTVTVAASIAIEWHEPAFAWDYNTTGVQQVTVFKDEIWTPLLINGQTIESSDTLLDLPPVFAVGYTGSVTTISMTTLTVSCAFDMEWFPFDEQRCVFSFFPFNADSATTNIIGFKSLMTESIQSWVLSEADWSLQEVSLRQTATTLNISRSTLKRFTYASFEVLMKRKSETFYIRNLIFPAVATAVLTLGVFLIPAASGEKVSYLISIFISMTVFLSSVSNTMPKGGSGQCRFNAILVAITVKIMLAMVATVVVLRRYNQEQKEEREVTKIAASDTDNNRDVNYTLKHVASSHPKSSGPGSKDVAKTKNNNVDVLQDPIFTSRSPPRSVELVGNNPKGDSYSHLPDLSTVSSLSDLIAAVSNICNSVTKGERLTSSSLDFVFFITFTIISSITYTCIMHA